MGGRWYGVDSSGLVVSAEFLDICRLKSEKFLTCLYGVGSFRIGTLNVQI